MVTVSRRACIQDRPGVSVVKFNRDDVSSITILRVDRGEIRVGDARITSDVALLCDDVILDYPIAAIEDLTEADLEPILSGTPEIVILGTGWRAQRPPRDLVFALARRGIGFESMDTPAACRTFNILIGEGRRAAVLLKLSD